MKESSFVLVITDPFMHTYYNYVDYSQRMLVAYSLPLFNIREKCTALERPTPTRNAPLNVRQFLSEFCMMSRHSHRVRSAGSELNTANVVPSSRVYSTEFSARLHRDLAPTWQSERRLKRDALVNQAN